MAVLLLLLSVVAVINVAAAATLDVRAGKLSAFDEPVVRCAPSVPLAKVDTQAKNNERATVAVVAYDVPADCVGEAAQTTIYGASGAPLGSGTGIVATPTFVIPLSPTAPTADYFGTALAVGGLQVGVGGSDLRLHIAIDDWFQGYCADVTVTNVSSSTSVDRSLPVALNGYPLDGEIQDEWGQVSAGGPDQFTVGVAIGAGESVTGGFCAERQPLPPAETGDYDVVVRGSISPTDTQYCADVTVNNTGSEPLAWRVKITVADHHPADVHGGTVYDLWNAEYTPDGAYDGSAFTVEGTDWNRTIPPGETRPFGFCVSGLESGATTEPDPDPSPGATIFEPEILSPEAHEGTSYTADVEVTTNSPSSTSWEATFDVSEYGTPDSVTVSGDVELVGYEAPMLTVAGPSVSESIPAGFSYTASGVAQIMPGPEDLALSYVESQKGGGGKDCQRVTVGTSSSEWHPWQVELHLPDFTSAPNVSEGGVGTWDAVSNVLTVRGDAGTWPLRANEKQQFKYCP